MVYQNFKSLFRPQQMTPGYNKITLEPFEEETDWYQDDKNVTASDVIPFDRGLCYPVATMKLVTKWSQPFFSLQLKNEYV